MTDDDTDKTDEIRERLVEDSTVGGTTDDDNGAVLTIDGNSGEADGQGEGTGDESANGDGGA